MRRDAKTLLPSVLNRLLDDEPDATIEDRGFPYSLGQVRDAIEEDLLNLVHTCQALPADLPAEYQEVRRSLLAYGLGKSGVLGMTDADREEVRRGLEEAITLFEPRLEGTQVHLLRRPEQGGALHFDIRGALQVEPVPESVRFEAVLPAYPQVYTLTGLSADDEEPSHG